MKKMVLFLLFAGMICGMTALEPGGVSVDLAAFQVDRTKIEGENLLKNGSFDEPGLQLDHWQTLNTWSGAAYVHALPFDGISDGLKKELLGLTRRFLTEDNPYSGKFCMALNSPLEIQKRRSDGGKPMISNRITQSIEVPASEQPLKYRLAWFGRGCLENVPGLNSFRIFATFSGADKKETRKGINQEFSLQQQWGEQNLEFVVPPGTVRMTFSLALYGVGEVFIDNVRLTREEMSRGVTARLMPYGFGDKIYHAAAGCPAILSFCFNNQAAAKTRQLCLAVKLPAGIRFVDAGTVTPLIRSIANPDSTTTCLLDLQQLGNNIDRDFYGTWNSVSLLVKNDLAPSEQLLPAEYWVEDGEYRSAVETFKLKIIPPFKGERPKIFRSGAIFARDFDYAGTGSSEAAGFYLKSGFNSIHGNLPVPLSQALKKDGIERYIQPYYLCNGYRIGGDPKPPEAQFRLVDGSAWTKPHEQICPVEVYKQGTYYRSKVVPMLERILVTNDLAEQIMPNWEPYSFDYKGCFCDRCREEFIRYTAGRIDAGNIRAKWPANIIASYKVEWIKFRSWQHGRLMAQLEKTIHEIGIKAGKDSHFIPEISWSKLIPGEEEFSGQYNIADYIDDLPWLEPWGPYIFHRFTMKYEYFPGLHLITWTAAGVMKDFAANLAKKNPKLIAFPHSFQGNDWLTEPEALAFEFHCFFLNGWDGGFAYYFPRGYDHLYWTAMAKANTEIARYENFVYHGKNITGSVTVTPETALPKPFFPVYWNEGGNFTRKLPALNTATMLQYRAFELNGRILAAVGNFWQKGESFFKLQLGNLKDAERYAVMLNEQYLGAFSGAELKNGITAHAGALRWSFIIVEPFDQTRRYDAPLTQTRIKELLKERSKAINRAAAWEEQYRKEHDANLASENPANDYNAIQPVSTGTVSLKPVENRLEISTPKYSVLLEPDTGARLLNWRAGDVLLSESQNQMGFCVDSFWWPKNAACLMVSGYKLLGAQAEGKVLKVSLSRTVSERDNAVLAGLVLNKTYRFYPEKIEVSTEIVNSAQQKIEFSFRYHHLPAFLRKGEAVFGDGVRFKRELLEKLYRFAASDQDLEGAFRMNKIFQTTSSRVEFVTPDSPMRLVAEIQPENLQCVVFWDSGRQACSSFEPVFKKVALAPGEKISYRLDWLISAPRN